MMPARYSKQPITIRFERETINQANDYIQQQKIPPTFSSVVRVALNYYLVEKLHGL
jgi:hypothetical protein